MTTLIAVYNSEGCVGRCDARCYLARSKKCHCICGGKNHGSGFTQATLNVLNMVGLTDDDLKQYAEAAGRDPKDLKVIDRVAVPSARRARKQALAAITEPQFNW